MKYKTGDTVLFKDYSSINLSKTFIGTIIRSEEDNIKRDYKVNWEAFIIESNVGTHIGFSDDFVLLKDLTPLEKAIYGLPISD